LILLTPGFFWTEHLKSLIDFLTTAILSVMSEFNIQPDMRRAFAPLPIQPSDFTSVQRWHDFIEKDPLRTTKVSLNFGAVSRQMQEMSLEAILDVEVPVFFALAERDRIVDNEKVQHHIEKILTPSPRNRLTFFDAEHAIHFTKAADLAKEIQSFVVASR
jgi:alpha-beta hydrolase superfamily lysophospholipase